MVDNVAKTNILNDEIFENEYYGQCISKIKSNIEYQKMESVVNEKGLKITFGFAKIEDKHDGIFLANKLLGVCLGFFQCLVVIYVIIFLVTVLPSNVMGWLQKIIDQSKICKFLSNYNLFTPILSLFANL